MPKKWTIEASVLDVLADDGESIIQIENALARDNIALSRIDIKTIIIKLLKEDLVYIAHPYTATTDGFIFCSEDTIEDYWFEMTSLGRSEWEQYENIPEEHNDDTT